MDAHLRQAYEATCYEVEGFSQPICIGKTSPDADDVLKRIVAASWAFITAYNPGSAQLPAQENEMRNAALRLALRQYFVLNGIGRGVDGNWPPEPSFWVAGISLSDAIALAEEYGQNAIVFGRPGGVAQLVMTQHWKS